MGQVLADPEYLQKIDAGGGLFIGGQTRDSLWSQI
jgi:hypothetical protein